MDGCSLGSARSPGVYGLQPMTARCCSRGYDARGDIGDFLIDARNIQPIPQIAGIKPDFRFGQGPLLAAKGIDLRLRSAAHAEGS